MIAAPTDQIKQNVDRIMIIDLGSAEGNIMRKVAA
jgi:hypothetical protein